MPMTVDNIINSMNNYADALRVLDGHDLHIDYKLFTNNIQLNSIMGRTPPSDLIKLATHADIFTSERTFLYDSQPEQLTQASYAMKLKLFIAIPYEHVYTKDRYFLEGKYHGGDVTTETKFITVYIGDKSFNYSQLPQVSEYRHLNNYEDIQKASKRMKDYREKAIAYHKKKYDEIANL